VRRRRKWCFLVLEQPPQPPGDPPHCPTHEIYKELLQIKNRGWFAVLGGRAYAQVGCVPATAPLPLPLQLAELAQLSQPDLPLGAISKEEWYEGVCGGEGARVEVEMRGCCSWGGEGWGGRVRRVGGGGIGGAAL